MPILFSLSLRWHLRPILEYLFSRRDSQKRFVIAASRLQAYYWATFISGNLERMIKKEPIPHLLSYGIINASKHGFLQAAPDDMCTTGILCLIAKGSNESKSMTALLLDMTKAFEHVPHQRLQAKIESCYREFKFAWFSP